MTLNRQPDAPEFARKAAAALNLAVSMMTEATEWSVAAGAQPARRGITAAKIKVEGWRDKLEAAARSTEEERR